MGSRHIFSWFSPRSLSAHRRTRRPRKPTRRPELECLEDRTVPTIIYKPVFGIETQSQGNGETGIQPQIYLTFWGQYWQGAVGASQVPLIQNAASQIISSQFPSLLSQYGADVRNMTIAKTAFYIKNNSDPTGFDPKDDVGDVVSTLIDNGTFPESDADPLTDQDDGQGNDHSRIYVVVTPPNCFSNKGITLTGENAVTSDTDLDFGTIPPSIDSDDIGQCWVSSGSNGGAPGTGTVPTGPTGALDQFSLNFSHELAELMSDWDQEGFEVNTPSGAPNNPTGASTAQIGDLAGVSYSFRLSNGVDVQALWSKQDFFPGFDSAGQGAWAVYDGTNQKFFLKGHWNLNFTGTYDLTIQGDQNANPDDVITVGTVASGPQKGGLQVTENGETVSFDPGQITGVTINAGTGNNTVTINPLPAGIDKFTMDSVGGTINLLAPNTPNVWDITGPGSGTLNGIAFSNATSLTGGTNTDTFNFQPGGSIPGNLDGGGGGDTLNYSGVAGPVTVNLQSHTAPGIGGTFSNITSVVGSAASDTLVGPDAGATWNLTGANSGTVAGVSFSSFEKLQGGSGDDKFVFAAAGSVSGNIDGGAGSNTLDYSALGTPVSVNLQTRTASGVGGTFANIGTVIGGSGSNTLTGPDAAASWSLTGSNSGSVNGTNFSAFANLQGGTGDDQFLFQPGGSVSGNINGGGGTNTLDYSALAGPVTVNFFTGTASDIGGTFAGITKAIGSQSNQDTIIGPDAAWTISGANSGTVNDITFSSFENLTGSSGADTFTFLPGGSISGNLDGGAGANTLDFSNLAGPITVNLQALTAPGIGGTFSNITSLVGSAGSDTLVGPDAGATWNLTGANSGSVAGVSFSSFENLQGGSGDDQFVFFPGGGVSGNIDGGAGNNTLDYHNLTTNVTIGLGASTATGIGGTFSNINSFVGGGGPNTVVGPAGGATWTVTGLNTIKVLGFTFGNFQSITGGAGNDTFAFVTGGHLTGAIDGGGGVNTLTYAAYTGDVLVDLLIHSATGVDGGVSNVQNVTGSNGNSLLVGDANPNVLLGGTGRNVLIGDAGADSLTGGGQDNILIGDSTVWDANLTALRAIFAEWTRTDLSFEQRLAHLISVGQNDGRLNGSYVLNNKTVISDGAVDTLTGGSPGALDWFFVTLMEDIYHPHNPRDHITVL
jgi:hypothetical protein